VIKDRDEHVKFQMADFPMYPRLAVLDPDATRTLPSHIAAATGMDAMTHAIEGHVSSEWNPHASAYALQALRLIRDNLEQAVIHPEDEAARGNMLIAASLAIMPTASAAIGITHSLSHPCGAHYDVAIHLPWVIEFNAAGGEPIADRYREINELLGLEVGGSADQIGHVLADHVREVVRRLGLPTRLSEVGVRRGSRTWSRAPRATGARWSTPRQPSAQDFEELYRRAL
jgi:alcohol dehydrogenase class IV